MANVSGSGGGEGAGAGDGVRAVVTAPHSDARQFVARVIKAEHIVRDCVICVIAGVLGILIDNNTFTSPRVRGFYLDDRDISLPMTDETFSTAALALAIVLGPPIVIVLCDVFGRPDMQKKRRTREIVHKMALYFFGLAVVLTITAFAKDTVGRLRPDFLARCDPDPSLLPAEGTWVPPTLDVCRGEDKVVEKGRKSFPSGHASTSSYTATFVMAYVYYFPIGAAAHNTLLCVPLLQLLPLLLMLVGTFTRIGDNVHHPSDVLAGAALGFLGTLYVFKMLYHGYTTEAQHAASADKRYAGATPGPGPGAPEFAGVLPNDGAGARASGTVPDTPGVDLLADGVQVGTFAGDAETPTKPDDGEAKPADDRDMVRRESSGGELEV